MTATLRRPGLPRLLRLDDGTRVLVRHIRSDDKARLRDAFARSSPATRYRRFLHGKRELTDDDLRYFTEVDGTDHVALLAVVATAAGLETEETVGVARFIRLPDEPDVAEFAIVVVDGRHRQGVGTGLFGALIEAATQRGIRLLRGYLLADNDTMRALLRRCCAGTRIEPDGALVVADCRLPAPVAAGGVRAATVLRAADELWWLAAERALMLPLEYACTASRLLGSEIDLLRALSAPPPGRESEACPGCDDA